ncbi:YifB family Mg chelatase-like AAA ATPase [Microaerobacter geothermalis]|uniref:YifB family Mg chelatase-like AAA ATPase n=1 Tax=Microaerobacter geothermalis TaxID=674972 RepID=UPI001F2BE6DB|nr:YifB family Mg chelatase-like AAA ATPase [Microaerobacter geothermalis]MCF6095070.1 YifB family Mg chelatase-like AAA ATPase [Microaerobacter geothermalis]
MYAKLLSGTTIGIEGHQIEVEVDISNGLPSLTVVGLPDSAVKEAKERVRAAIKNSGFTFPMQRITVNLAPADLKKEGTSFDLAIAIGILMASGQLEPDYFRDTLVMGELALDGSIRPVSGILVVAEMAYALKINKFILPTENIDEALLIGNLPLFPLIHLQDLKELPLREANGLSIEKFKRNKEMDHSDRSDFSHIKGHSTAKRAFEVAAAGWHHVLMAGTPGSGKTLFAQALPSILPPLSHFESLEVTKIYSVAGQLEQTNRLISKRPFRSPHHTISQGGLVGGGPIPKPGEISLAHRGVLFLDELPEFPRQLIDILRQPLEEGGVTLSRARLSVHYPSRFLLVLAMNP